MKNSKTTSHLLLLCTFIFAGSLQLGAQEIGDIIKVKMNNGNIHYGELSEKTDSSIVINNDEFGEHHLFSKDVKYTIPAGKNKKGVYYGQNPNPYYYLFSPSGFGPKKGEAYYQNTVFFLHTFHFSLSNYYSISGGVEIASVLIDDASAPAFTLTQKLSIPINPNFRFGASLVYVKDNDWIFGEDLGIIYTSTTVGDRNINFTLGIGTEINDGGFVVTASGMVRLSPTLSIISENWLIPNAEGMIFSFGTRFIGDYISVDIALASTSESERIPWLGMSFPF